jgi:hypothetical protein
MSLSSLIVQREVATIRQVEEALARQVLYGGDLVTNVLEVAQVPESVLVPLLAETSHMPHAPLGTLPAPSPAALKLVPADLAMRRSLYPLDVVADALIVAVAEPLDADVVAELAFALGVLIEQRVAPLVRVREALASAYGAPLDRRMQRLIARLSGVDTGSGSLPPLLARSPANAFHTPSIEAPRVPAEFFSPEHRTRRETPPLGSMGAVAKRSTAAGFPAPTPGSDREPDTEKTEPMPPVSSGPAVVAHKIVQLGEATPMPPQAVHRSRHPTLTSEGPSTSPSPIAAAATAAVAAAATGTSAPAEEPKPAALRKSSVPPKPSSLVRLVQSESFAPRTGRKRRGPVTLERAKHELEQATERDALLDLFFAFSLQFFEYSALFIVHGDIAEGRDAYGPGATRDKVLGVGVPLDLPSALSEARDRSAPVIARPAKEGLDAVLAHDLDRSPEWPILVVPVVVRGRTVSVLYGDNGDAGVDGPGSGEVTAFAARVGQAFERIIVRRKLGGFAADAPSAKPRVDPKRVAAKVQRISDPHTRDAAADVLQKALGPDGHVRPPSAPPPPPEPVAPLETVPAPPPVIDPEPAELDPTALVEVDERDDDDDGSDEPVLPLVERRTMKDLSPPFDDTWGEAIPAVAPEFSDLPPPPQVAAVRQISVRPIPREDPPEALLTLDSLTPAPVRPNQAVSAPAPAVDSAELDDEAAARLLEELEKTDPSLDTSDLPEIHPSNPGGGVSVSSLNLKPPPSQAVAVPPHKPPTPRPRPDSLPSVIIDSSTDFLVLVDRLAKNPKDEHAEAELLRQGQYAMPAIMARFPGPITMSLSEIEEKRPRVGDCGPILKLIAGQRRVALPFVLVRVESGDPEARFWATFLLTELAYPEAVPAIVARLFDEEERTRRVARQAAKVVADAGREPLVEELDRIVRDPKATIEKRIRTMDALGEMRDAIVVPVLIGALGEESEEVATAARRALTIVSRQDFGKDTRRWLAWWAQSSSRHRIEWLIDALTHEQAAMRKAAAQELKSVTREYFGYYDDLPKRERERAQQRYRDWWRSEGRARFRKE